MEIQCLIVDDEPPAVDELKFILSCIEGVSVVGAVNSAESAVSFIHNKQPDLVFLDIKMPGHDGFDVVHACADFQKIPLFVFATAYDEHAIKSFEASAVDYILKPCQPERVEASVERVRKLLLSQQQGELCGRLEKLVSRFHPATNSIAKVSVEHKGRILLLDPKIIAFFKAENKGIFVYTDTTCYPLHGAVSMDNLASRLEAHGFFRTHRGYLVNLGCVSEVVPWFNGKYILKTIDYSQSEIPVSRRRVKLLKQRLGL